MGLSYKKKVRTEDTMAKSFNELVKNFAVLRNYVREFYVYGFKQREDFTEKSGRSYDNVRRRVESYLREYVDVEQQASGRALRLFIDPNEITENPMFAVWQAKSFTKNDIFLHFVLMDLFQEGVSLSVNQVLARIDEEYFVHFQDGFLVEALTLRKKIDGVCGAGCVTTGSVWACGLFFACAVCGVGALFVAAGDDTGIGV